jgi:hypothetical protein
MKKLVLLKIFNQMKTILISLLLITPLVLKAQGWAPNTRFQTGTWQTLNVKYEIHPKTIGSVKLSSEARSFTTILITGKQKHFSIICLLISLQVD